MFTYTYIYIYLISSSSWAFPVFSHFFPSLFTKSRKPPGFGGSGGGRGRGSGPLRGRLPRRGQCPGGVHRGAAKAADGGGWRLWLRVACGGTRPGDQCQGGPFVIWEVEIC